MSLKKLFSRPGVVEYSSRRSMVRAPPPGTVTDRQGKSTSAFLSPKRFSFLIFFWFVCFCFVLLATWICARLYQCMSEDV